MKKIIALLLAVMMVLAMAACAAKTTDTPAPAETTTENKTDAVEETATEAATEGKTELNIGVLVRTEYSLSTAIERGVPCEMMTENQVANWDTAKAQEMMTAQIASLGVENIEVVFCNNDDMAIGVIAALNEVGYNLGDGGDEIIVIGVDCTDTAVEYINAGKLYGTVKQDGDAMGKANILMAINGALGKDWLDGTDYVMADDGFSIRIPYAKVTAE